jgi:hypothetical protein
MSFYPALLLILVASIGSGIYFLHPMLVRAYSNRLCIFFFFN